MRVCGERRVETLGCDQHGAHKPMLLTKGIYCLAQRLGLWDDDKTVKSDNTRHLRSIFLAIATQAGR